ncbi:MAG: CRISPR-associated protein Cas5 [Candidatus Omnitrophica bacterium]|nr:CRISPR-associated protein Cas5 [Candidatus Omnitrophota bacterium]
MPFFRRPNVERFSRPTYQLPTRSASTSSE